MMDTLTQDFRYALRQLARRPGFTTAAVLTLALGIGATTAGFSIANWLLLRPVPGVQDQDRLATVWFGMWTGGASVSPSSLSDLNHADLMRGVTALSGLAGYWPPRSVSLGAERAGARRVEAQFVMANYLDVLKARLQIGRGFNAEEDRPPHGSPVAVISDRLWATLFNRDRAAIGTVVRLNGLPFTIIGVTERGFHGAERIYQADLWLPGNSQTYVLHFGELPPVPERERGGYYSFVARLAPGATFEQAEAQLQVGSRGLADLYPDHNQKYTEVKPVLFSGIGSSPLGRGLLAHTMHLLMGVTALLLLIACANVANLLLFRGLAAQGDLAVRRALGAGTYRLAQQNLAGSILLALLGGAAGVLFSLWLVDLFEGANLLHAYELRGVELDGRVLAFACGTSLLTGLLAGLVPALSATRADPLPTLKGAGPTETGRRGRIRSTLVIVQLSVCLVLLVGALLFVRTLRHLAAVELGFDPSGVAMLSARPQERGYSPERTTAYWETFVNRLSSTPGVERVALANGAPFYGTFATQVAAARNPGMTPLWAARNDVTQSYFPTLRIPLLRGTGFSGADSVGDVVVLSATLARRLFPGTDALGELVEFPTARERGRQYRVVGIAADTRWRSLETEPELLVYLPYTEHWLGTLALARSTLPTEQITAAGERIANELDSSLPLDATRTVAMGIQAYLAERRLFAKVLGLLGSLGAALAAVGLYGLIAFGVALRTRELGIRIALGARPGDVLRLVLRDGARLVAIGIAVGAVAAALATRLIQNRLWGVSPLDLVTYAGAVLLLAGAALLASFIPARTASKIEPMVALRYE